MWEQSKISVRPLIVKKYHFKFHLFASLRKMVSATKAKTSFFMKINFISFPYIFSFKRESREIEHDSYFTVKFIHVNFLYMRLFSNFTDFYSYTSNCIIQLFDRTLVWNFF